MCADYKVTGCLPGPPSPHHVHSLVPVRIEHTVPVLPHDDYRCNWGRWGILNMTILIHHFGKLYK